MTGWVRDCVAEQRFSKTNLEGDNQCVSGAENKCSASVKKLHSFWPSHDGTGSGGAAEQCRSPTGRLGVCICTHQDTRMIVAGCRARVRIVV